MLDEHGGRTAPHRGQQGASAALSDGAVGWLQHLPQHVQPLQTATRFPHIANALAANWQAPESCRAYFEQLLLDHRGNRQGFPRPIAAELAALKDYYESVVHPTRQTVWDEILGHARR